MSLPSKILNAVCQEQLDEALEALQIPILVACKDIAQNQYHQETVYTHLILTAKALPINKPLLRLAGLFHDIGKPMAKAGTGPTCTFHKHEIYGARIAYEYMTQVGFPYQDCQYISRIIRHHMFRFWEQTHYKTIKKWYKKNKDIFEDLFLLRQADRNGNLLKRSILITPQMNKLREIVNQIIQEDIP